MEKTVNHPPVSFLDLLQLDVTHYPIIAVVGGGGKTSLIFRLTRELVERGQKVIVTTTTHMAYDPEQPFAKNASPVEIRKCLKKYGYVIAASLSEEALNTQGKYQALPEEQLKELHKYCDVVLIEADGSRQLPLKVPEAWEPVIPACAQLVISVIGLDCLGKPICQTAHRMERTSELLSKGLDAPVTEYDVVKIATSICGLYKNVEDRVYRVYLNKADALKDIQSAQKILEELNEQGTIAAYGSLLPEDVTADNI